MFINKKTGGDEISKCSELRKEEVKMLRKFSEWSYANEVPQSEMYGQRLKLTCT